MAGRPPGRRENYIFFLRPTTVSTLPTVRVSYRLLGVQSYLHPPVCGVSGRQARDDWTTPAITADDDGL